MCGRFQTPTLIVAINFITQLRYPRANCHHISCTAHKKRTVVEVNSIIRYECMPRTVLKGNSGLNTSWTQMKEHEKSKRTSHH